MGSDIYKEFSVARQVVDECEETLGARLKNIMFEGPPVGWSLVAVLLTVVRTFLPRPLMHNQV